MRYRFTTPLGITAVLTKAGELYELEVDLPDRLTREHHQELEQLLRFSLGAVEVSEDSEAELEEQLAARARIAPSA